MVTTLSGALETYVKHSINEIFSRVTSTNMKNYEEISYEPTFKKNGVFDDSVKVTSIDFKKLVYDYKNDLEKKPYYKIAFLALKNKLKIEFNKAHISVKGSIDEIAHRELRDFLISYFRILNYKKFNIKKFRTILTNFLIYIETELGVSYCFSPILNFEGNFSFLQLDNNLRIRRITPDEFSVISEIKNKTEKIDVDATLFKIKFVIDGKIKQTQVKEQNVLKLFEKTIAALKIFQNGKVKLGGIYFRNSEFWLIKPTFILRREPKTILDSPYILKTRKSILEFKKFHKIFYGLNLTKGKYVFLNRSISRFSQALENNILEDQVVDYVTSLESLYSSNEQELSYKFALRIGALIGITPKEKINLQQFMLQIYNMRSKIVHGDFVPEHIEIKEVGLSLPKKIAIEILENITRNSIMLFLNLINNYEKKEDIQKELEKSVFDPKLKNKFSQLIKNSRKIDLKFLQRLT